MFLVVGSSAQIRAANPSDGSYYTNHLDVTYGYTHVGAVDCSADATHITYLGNYYTAVDDQNTVTMPYYRTESTNTVVGITAIHYIQFTTPVGDHVNALIKSSVLTTGDGVAEAHASQVADVTYAIGIGAVGTSTSYCSSCPHTLLNENYYWMVDSFTDLDSFAATIDSQVCSSQIRSDNTVATGKLQCIRIILTFFNYFIVMSHIKHCLITLLSYHISNDDSF